jgi:predicted nucleic acid-binding protein
MPDLNNVPGGTSIFVDTNIFHFHFQGKSLTCTNFIQRIQNREIEAYVNIQVLADLMHKLMFAEALAKGCTRSTNPQELKRYLKTMREARQALPLTDYEVQFALIASIGLHVLPVNEKLLADTRLEREQYYLMTGDSLHLGTMSRRLVNRRSVPLQNIATYDGDFAHIPGITLWKPMDIPTR